MNLDRITPLNLISNPLNEIAANLFSFLFRQKIHKIDMIQQISNVYTKLVDD